jgi:hypothetical protein
MPAFDGIKLTWTAPADNGSAITGYRIDRGSRSGGEVLTTSVGVATGARWPGAGSAAASERRGAISLTP